MHTTDSDSTHIYQELDDASDEDDLLYWPAQAPPTLTATCRPLFTHLPHLRSNCTMDTQPYAVAPLAPTAKIPGPYSQRTAWTSCSTPRDAYPQTHTTLWGSVCRHTQRHPTHARIPPSSLPWSAYLNTLPHIACRHYLNMPTNYSDVNTEITQPLDQPLNAARFSPTFLGGNPPAPVTTIKV